MSMQIADKIELWPIKRLTPYERNSRTHSDRQIKQIEKSIEEFGFLNPILVDENSTIIAGHGRLEAAKNLGMETVPVVPLTHLSDFQKRAYIIADNKLAELAGWDDDLLKLELAELSDLNYDVELTGFDLEELGDILDGVGDEQGEKRKAEFEFNDRTGSEQNSGPIKLTVECEDFEEAESLFNELKKRGLKVKR